ncbi:MAG: Gfo/Idh/MocA family oxidoreductase [Methanobacterium sp.]
MDKNINVGIIGMGKMGILHTGILNSLDGANVKGVTEKQDLVLKPIRQLLPLIGTYNNYLDMIKNEDLDLIYITTPTSFHTNIALDCVDEGIPFFVEKPLGVSVDDCKPLIEAIQKKPVISMIGYSKRFTDTFLKAKGVIDSGVLGELIYFSSSMYISQLFSKGKGWRYKKEASGGGVLSTLAAHLIDLLIWFFGDVSFIEGNTKSYYSKDVEDFVHAYLLFKGGLEGYIDTSWSVRNYRLPEIKIEVHGEKGMLVVTDDYVKIYSDQDSRWETYYKQDLYEGVGFDLGGPEYTREDIHMIESVKQERASGLDIFDGFKAQKVVEGIYKSASTKSAVEGDEL